MFTSNTTYFITTSENARSARLPSKRKGFVESTRIVDNTDVPTLSMMKRMLAVTHLVGYLPFLELNGRMFLAVTHRARHKFAENCSKYVFIEENGRMLCYPANQVPYDPRPVQQEVESLLAGNCDPETATFLLSVHGYRTKLPKRVAERFEKIKLKIKK